MEPHFALYDEMFERYLHNATNYLNWFRWFNVSCISFTKYSTNIFSESDKKWLDELQQKLKNNSKIKYLYVDFNPNQTIGEIQVKVQVKKI